SGSLSVVSGASDPSLSVSLSGTGTSAGQLSVSPGSMSFGTVTVGATQSQTGALSASGSSVTVSSASSSSSEFALTGLTFPLTIAAGQSVPFTRSEEHTSELQSRGHLVCRLLLEKKKKKNKKFQNAISTKINHKQHNT